MSQQVKIYILIAIIATAVTVISYISFQNLFRAGNVQKENQVSETEKNNFILNGSLVVNTNKNIYERTDEVIFTIKNDSNKEMFSTWSGKSVGFHVTFEKYNNELNEWQVSRHFFENSAPSLTPEESVSFKKELMTDVPITDIKSKFRIMVEYLDYEECKYPDYMEDASLHSFCYDQVKTIYSNEFLVDAPMQAATEFCMNRKNNEQSQNNFALAASYPSDTSYVGPVFYLNFESNKKKDIVGTCDPDSMGGYRVLFVLAYRDGAYEPVLVEESNQVQGFANFVDLKVKDIDQDGIDEIIYSATKWTMNWNNTEINVYAPKYQEWFSVMEDVFYDEGVYTRNVTYSDNLENKNFIHFKEFLKSNEPNSIASEICNNYNKKVGKFYSMIAFQKANNKKDFLGTCTNNSGMINMLFVADEERKILLEKIDEYEAMRHFFVKDIKILDIDGDGLDEIVYTEEAWGGYFVDKWTHLYSPSVKEWFFVKESEFLDETRRDLPQLPCKVKIAYSDNLDDDKYIEYKNFLKIDERSNCIFLER